MARRSLPPGFRFHPMDVELVLYYLKRKVMGKKLHYEAIAEVNIYKFSPWDLPDKSLLKSKDLEWFFFCPREKKYASGSRVKRATENGYWKTTGKDRNIRYNDRTVGAVKTLVFHLGHAPQGERTDWVIHEYRILDDELAAAGVQDTYVLCKVFKKNGLGPKNGAQYGAPFNEADWTDDVDGAENHDISLGSDGPSLTAQVQTEERASPFKIGLLAPGSTSGLPLFEEGPPPSAGRPTSEVVADVTDNEMLHLLAPFTDEDMLLSCENGINQDHLSRLAMNEVVPCSDGQDIYNGLGDLGTWGQMDQGRLDFSRLPNDEYFLNDRLSLDNSTYIELDDLLPPLDFSVTGADQPSLGVTPGDLCHENMQQLYSEDRSAGMGQYASCVNGLPLLPQGSYEGHHCSVVRQTVDQQIYQGANAPYDLSFAFVGQENKGYLNNIMERGPRILVDRNPARLPTAAALLYISNGGSSIHIKAEVTHRAGECTNEALSVMMGGSGSCWCTKHPGAVLLLLLLLLVNQLPEPASIIYYSLVFLSFPPSPKKTDLFCSLFIYYAFNSMVSCGDKISSYSSLYCLKTNNLTTKYCS